MVSTEVEVDDGTEDLQTDAGLSVSKEIPASDVQVDEFLKQEQNTVLGLPKGIRLANIVVLSGYSDEIQNNGGTMQNMAEVGAFCLLPTKVGNGSANF